MSAYCNTGRFWIKNWQDLHLAIKCHSRHFPFFRSFLLSLKRFFIFNFCFILLYFFDVFSKKKPWSLHILEETILLKQTTLYPSDHWFLNTILFFFFFLPSSSRLGAVTIALCVLRCCINHGKKRQHSNKIIIFLKITHYARKSRVKKPS